MIHGTPSVLLFWIHSSRLQSILCVNTTGHILIPLFPSFLFVFPSFFCTRNTITIFSDCSGLLLQKTMSQTLASTQLLARTSVMVRTPALLIGMGTSRLSRTILYPLGRSMFATATQQKAQRGVTVPRKFLARRVQQDHRINRSNQLSSRPTYQRMPRKLAAATNRDRYSGRQSFSFWAVFHQRFWPTYFTLLFLSYWDRFVQTGRLRVKD